MFKAHQHNITGQNVCEEKWTKEQHVAHSEAAKTIRKELVDFCKFMQQYAKENSMEEDELLNTLTTDLTVVAKTFGSPRAALYTATKCNSQGRQTSNNTNYIDPNDLFGQRQSYANHGLRRQNALGVFQGDLLDTDELADLPTMPRMQSGLTRAYTTPRQMTLMRSITGESAELDELDVITPPTVPTQSEEEETI
jgi:hypothetical protein